MPALLICLLTVLLAQAPAAAQKRVAGKKPSSPAAAKPERSENDFYRDLGRKKIATQEDIIRAVARFKGYKGQDRSEAEMNYLLDEGIKFPKNALRTMKRPVTKGDAAILFLSAMGAVADKRGLPGRFFTRNRRYALRDAVAQKLLPEKSYAGEFISGGELLAMLGRAVEQRDKAKERAGK